MSKVAGWGSRESGMSQYFETAQTWRIEGMPDANVYPVPPIRKPWFLDRQRKTPQLQVNRTQYPLAPGFAITAHIAQGQTLHEGVIADFNISNTGNPFTTYVAATRVTGRDKLLILRPFPAKPFQKGIGIGRGLLLQVWRGDPVNWNALLAKYAEERVCSECKEQKGKNAYTVGQWKRCDVERVCRECIARHREAGEAYQCNVCKFWFDETGFSATHRQRQCSFYRVCLTCEIRKACYRCKTHKAAEQYTASAWKARNADRRICRDCATKLRGCWTCQACRQTIPKSHFQTFLQTHPAGQHGNQVCDTCQRTTALQRYAARTAGRLQRHRARTRRREVLEEVRREVTAIVQSRSAQQQDMSRAPPSPRHADGPKAQESHPGPRHDAAPRKRTWAEDEHTPEHSPRQQETPAMLAYKCPHCQATVRSTVSDGTVHVRGHCGRQFRVRKGVVSRLNSISCPTCGTRVLSTRTRGQIQGKHTKPNGKACPTTRWYVK